MLQYCTDIAVKHIRYISTRSSGLFYNTYVLLLNIHSIPHNYHNINILVKMLNSNMQYRSNYQWKSLTLTSPYTVPLSLLLSCTLYANLVAAGEVAKDEKHLRR